MYATVPLNDVYKSLGSSAEGLHLQRVRALQQEVGFNELPTKRTSRLLVFLRQFQDVLVYILIGALVLSVVLNRLEGSAGFSEYIDAFAIVAILLLNAVLGYVQEFRAEQSMESLKKLSAPTARVRRDGNEHLIPSRELVPGDVVIVETGDRIAADGRVVKESHLEVNESSLTGESTVVAKHTGTLKEERPLAERTNMLFAGTLVTRGSAEYIVTATGLHTEIGTIAKLVSGSVAPETPLSRRMKRLSGIMGITVVLLCAALGIILLLRGETLLFVVMVAVSLAVSAVPEGLPAVVTASLAMGVRRMVGKHALVMRLDSLETLGSVTVICTDKTGTITENAMNVTDTWVPADAAATDGKLLLQIAASCNRAELPNLGDPTEVGLLRYARENKVERLPIDEEEVPFTSELKYMQTRHGTRSFLKGAVERMEELCASMPSSAKKQNEKMAARGLRVLAMAVREKGAKQPRFVGLIGMEDPPRKEVKAAIRKAGIAGIRTVMITGDNRDTAAAIAAKVGMSGDVVEGAKIDGLSEEQLHRTLKTASVFARVSPMHKITILKALQQEGEIVAMTGDGVNDAPALKAAHVGIAMGKDGTQVAREAASLVLTDDNYATIVAAIAEGRRIYDNIRKFVIYLLRANLGQLMLFTATVALGLPLPLLPVHILWINLMTDGLPALALSMEKPEQDIMKKPPRSSTEQLFTGQWFRLLLSSVLSAGLTFAIYIISLREGEPIEWVRTVVFTFSILFELLLAYVSRSTAPLWRIGYFSNRWLIGATLLPFALQAVLLWTPIGRLFDMAPVRPLIILFLLGVGLAGFFFLEIAKPLLEHFSERRASARGTQHAQ